MELTWECRSDKTATLLFFKKMAKNQPSYPHVPDHSPKKKGGGDPHVSNMAEALEEYAKNTLGILYKDTEPPKEWYKLPADAKYGAGVQPHQIAHKPAEKWQVPQKGFQSGPKGFVITTVNTDQWANKCCCANAWASWAKPNPFCPTHGKKADTHTGNLKEKLKASIEAEELAVSSAMTPWPDWAEEKIMPWYVVLREYNKPVYVDFRTWHKPGSIEYLWETAIVSAYETGIGVHGETSLPVLMNKAIQTVFPSIQYVQLIAAFKHTKFIVGGVTDVYDFDEGVADAIKGTVVVHGVDFPDHLCASLVCALDPLNIGDHSALGGDLISGDIHEPIS